MQNMVLCPSRVAFLMSCSLVQVPSTLVNHQVAVPCRLLCLHSAEDALMQIVMMCNGMYFLFFCRGFKLVGPMVIMIYR